MKIDIRPQVTLPMALVTASGLLANTQPHPDPRYSRWYRILPFEDLSDPGASGSASPPLMRNWLIPRFNPDGNGDLSLFGTAMKDGDQNNNFMEYATGGSPWNDGDPYMVAKEDATGNMILQHIRNGLDTGIEQLLEVSDGKTTVAAELGTDYDLYPIYGTVTESVADWDLTHFRTRLLRNLNPIKGAKAFLRPRLSWDI